MRKAIIALFATAGLAVGSLSVVTPAQAVEYPGTVKTATALSGSSKVVGGRTLSVSVRVSGGSASAVAGIVTFTFNGQTVKRTVTNGTGMAAFTAPKRNSNGSYTLRASYAPKAGSVYKASSTSRTITVTTTPNNVATTTTLKVTKNVKKGKKVKTTIKVSAKSGKPSGKVKVTVKGPGYNETKTFSVRDGKTYAPTFGPFKKTGTFKVTVTYSAGSGTPYKGSKKSASFKVK